MRILFTLITILFFSFNSANADYREDQHDALKKGEILLAYVQNGEEVFVVRYKAVIYRCRLETIGHYCIRQNGTR